MREVIEINRVIKLSDPVNVLLVPERVQQEGLQLIVIAASYYCKTCNLQGSARLKSAQQMARPESAPMLGLCNRGKASFALDEVETIAF